MCKGWMWEEYVPLPYKEQIHEDAGIPPEQKSYQVLNDIHKYLIWLEL